MAGLSNSAENNFLLLLFNNTNWANVGDATGLRGSTAPGSFYIGLSTGTLTDTSTQTTTEATYTNYARVAVARSGAGWTVSGTSPTQAANAAAITFPTCGVTGNTVTDACVGRDAAGAGEIIYYGALTASLAISNGITPSFAIGALVCTAD